MGDCYINAICLTENVRCDNIIRISDRDEPAVFHDRHVLANDKTVIRKVGTHNDGNPVFCKTFNETEHPDLITEIKMRGWLVQHHQCRLLRKCPGDKNQLEFATADLRDRPFRKMLDTDSIQCLTRYPEVLFSG